MFPKTRSFAYQHNQRGSMLIISLFVIVVMALLVLTLNRLLSASSDTLIFEVYGLRAHQAAKTGLEVKLGEVFPLCPPGSVNQVCVDGSKNEPNACDATTQLSLTTGGLQGCSVNSSCTATVTAGTAYYEVTSTATCEAGDIVTSRTVTLNARAAP
ncbi:hypothetical protein [Lacimicrobium sp. SS2-24]|uniref:hypothetical protein n=1 Tax=Lacimicrobium sp. SS2-24 TaxID=2005569 RepID=UPI000B4A5678|nr:hypothetical protein [Lacimicrobium sp. SS2-24]